MRTILLLLAVALCTSCVTSENPSGGSSGSGGGGEGGPAAPDANFLRTDYEPLEDWMDERFDVEYRDMTARLMFRQEPISAIRYELRNLPGESRRFQLKSDDISRREILESVARFYDLEMTVETVNGKPAYVRVVGRSTQPASSGGVYGSGPYGAGSTPSNGGGAGSPGGDAPSTATREF